MDSISCSHCKAPVAAAARFCGTCGTPQVVGAQKTEIPAWQRSVVDGFFRGRVGSDKESWNYENGLVRGPGVEFAWLGNVFRRPVLEKSAAQTGFGHYDGKTVSWSFDESRTFWQYELAPDEKRFVCVSIAFGPRFDWKIESGFLVAVEGNLEGAENSFEMSGGSVPLQVALFCAMYTRTQLLHRKFVERERRVYSRCNKVVLVAGQSPKLCAACASAVQAKCFCCVKEEGKYDANMCKNCSPKKGLCGRCAEPLKGSTVAAKLCTACGLGSRGMNCARLTFGANI